VPVKYRAGSVGSMLLGLEIVAIQGIGLEISTIGMELANTPLFKGFAENGFYATVRQMIARKPESRVCESRHSGCLEYREKGVSAAKLVRAMRRLSKENGAH